jgi:hypothetical protein
MPNPSLYLTLVGTTSYASPSVSENYNVANLNKWETSRWITERYKPLPEDYAWARIEGSEQRSSAVAVWKNMGVY